jgi:hypothetical protein
MLAFVIMKCSVVIMLEVFSLYATLQIHAKLTQTYKDADVGAKVTKFLTCAQPLINLAITITRIMNGHLKKHGKEGMNLPHKMRVSLQRQGLH